MASQRFSFSGNQDEFDVDAEETMEASVNPVSYRQELERTQSVNSRDFPAYAGGGGGGNDSLNNTTIATEDTTQGHTRLYTMCELAMPRPEDQGRTLTAAEAARRKEVLEETWERIREWLRAHPAAEDRSAAASYQGQFLSTPLHLVCKLADPPEDIVESLIQCSAETVTWADSNGWLCLHHACANGASWEVLNILVEAYPESKVTQDRRQRTPLHFAFFRSDADGMSEGEGGLDGKIGNSMADIVALLSDSGAAELPDEGGMLPIHYACAYGTSPAVLEVLASAYPDSVVARENKGRTPFHLAMVNAHRTASPSVIRFLLSLRGGDMINIADRDGHLPIHLLALASRFRPDQTEARANVSVCLKMYLNAQPRANADFLTAIQALPDWLQETAVVSPHVQDILNTKIVKRFPTSILMLDGYVLMMIIICFQVASKASINNRYEPDIYPEPPMGTLIALYIGGTYFLFRELVQMISLWSLGTFHSWLTDSTNWLDVTLIVLVFYCTTAMVNSNIGDNDSFRSLVACTKAVLWGSMISFLKSTLVDFAVFVGGVVYVVRRLGAFLLALGVIVLAFAQMFMIVYTETSTCNFDQEKECTGNATTEHAQLCYSEFPHCNFPDSFLKTYTMLMGEIGDESRYSNSNVAQFLYVAFAFLVVILLSNVLIAIVTDSYGVIKNDRAAIVFWSNRLDFVAEMDAISSVRKPSNFPFSKGKSAGVPGAPTTVQEGPYGEGVQVYAEQTGEGKRRSKQVFREAWKNLMSLFDATLYDDIDLHPGSFEFWCYFFFRIFAIVFIIPAWLVAGAATVGWLWPPQVREYLFVQKKTQISRADIAEQVSMQIDELREEIKRLRAELKGEMKNDRRELVQMKAEVESVQSAVMSDLMQVKEIMTTLLEMSRTQAQKHEERESAAALAAARAHQGGE